MGWFSGNTKVGLTQGNADHQFGGARIAAGCELV
jgi:hypothetical protein